MDKVMRDLAWKCLPKEARAYVREMHKLADQEYKFHKGKRYALEMTFGKHNLTSDTEPEEMLMISKQEFQKKYEACVIAANTCDSSECAIIADLLEDIFGDKCLPDKEPSVQVEPKFKIGDIVRVKYIPIYEGEIGIIDEIGSRILEYHLKGNKTLKNDWFAESYLEPYTEPETKPLRVGDKVKVKGEDKVREIFRILPDGRIMFGDKGNAYSVDEIELVEPETKDNMEEKELNLCELLKGCEGETLYSRAYGEVSLNEIVRDDRPNAQEIKVYTPDPQSDRIWFLRNGRKHKNGEIDLWPSRSLYEKYPLDPYSAWMEWKAQRELEFNKPECYITDVNKWWELKVVAKFHSSKEAQQAAEAMRECLEKFHSEHTKQ